MGIIDQRLLDLEEEFKRQFKKLDKLTTKPGVDAIEEHEKLMNWYASEKHYWNELRKQLEQDSKLCGEPYWLVEKAYFC